MKFKIPHNSFASRFKTRPAPEDRRLWGRDKKKKSSLKSGRNVRCKDYWLAYSLGLIGHAMQFKANRCSSADRYPNGEKKFF